MSDSPRPEGSRYEIYGPDPITKQWEGRTFTQAILSDTFNGYTIHVLNPNGKPNTPNADWNGFHITEYLDPSTVDSRPIIHEVRVTSGSGVYIEGDAGGRTFSATDDTHCFYTSNNIPIVHSTGSNQGHFSSADYTPIGGYAGPVRSKVDLIYASGGDDVIFAKTGNDTVYGLDGNDYIDGGAGDDSLDGGNGNDTIYGGDGNDYIAGDAGDDSLEGNAGDDVLDGGIGNDTIFGGDGNDYITGGTGNDYLSGGDGLDTLEGGDGDDVLIGGAGADVLMGGAGFDIASYEPSAAAVSVTLTDTMRDGEYVGYGSGGDAEDDAMLGIEAVIGSNSGDTLIGNSQDNSFDGLDGNDYIDGGAGNDLIYGGAGNDSLIGSTGSDTLYGQAGNDLYLWEVGYGMDFFVESTADAGTDTLVIRGTTDLYVLKDGNNLAIGTGVNNDWAIIYNYYVDGGMEIVNIGNVNYTTAQLAAMATSTASNDILPMSADHGGLSTEGLNSIDFSQVPPVDLSGLSPDDAGLALV